MSTSETKTEPKAVSVVCTDRMLTVTLADERQISAPLKWFPRLVTATPRERKNWELIGRGVGIHWPDVDEDISVAVLLGLDCV